MDYHRHLEEQKLLRMEEKERRMEIIHQSAPTVKPRVSESSLYSLINYTVS